MAESNLPPLKPLRTVYHPTTLWQQDSRSVTLKIQLPNIQSISLRVTSKEMLFWTDVNGKKYTLLIGFFADVIPAETVHTLHGAYVMIQVRKKKQENWDRLNSSSEKIPYLKFEQTDVDEDSDNFDFKKIRKDLPLNNEPNIHYGNRRPPEAVSDFEDDGSTDDEVMKALDSDDSSLASSDDNEID